MEGQLPEIERRTKRKKSGVVEEMLNEVDEKEREGSPVTHKVLLVEESKIRAEEGVDASARLTVVKNLQFQIKN